MLEEKEPRVEPREIPSGTPADLAARLLLFSPLAGFVFGLTFFALAGFDVPPFAQQASSWTYAGGAGGLVIASVFVALGGGAAGAIIAIVTWLVARHRQRP